MKRRIRFQERARRQRRGLFAFLIIFILICTGLSLFALADDGIDHIIVTVDNRDTLWNICASFTPKDMDIRDFIAKVRYLNNMKSSELSIGQEIKIPLK